MDEKWEREGPLRARAKSVRALLGAFTEFEANRHQYIPPSTANKETAPNARGKVTADHRDAAADCTGALAEGAGSISLVLDDMGTR